jgi:hypothetical protein
MSRTPQPDQYVFTFDAAGAVTSVAEVERNGRLDPETIEKDESYSLIDGLVVKTELDDGQSEWTVYADRDGDGRWTELADGKGPLDLGQFATPGDETVKQAPDDDAYVFQFDPTGAVVGVYEVERDGRLDREDVDRDESYALVNGLVIKTKVDEGQIEQTTYADADGDGVWHAVILPPPASLWDGGTMM